MQTVLPGIWTRVTVSISYDNNDYTTSFIYMLFLFFVLFFFSVLLQTLKKNTAERVVF